MKFLIKNLLSVLRRFGFSTVLNMVGLPVAFAVFMAIMMQVYYNRTYNESIKDYDKIAIPYNVTKDDEQHIYVSPPIMEAIAQSPHVKEYAFLSSCDDEVFFIGEQPAKGKLRVVSSSYPGLFGLEMVVGDKNCMSDDTAVMVPESFAVKYFGSASAAIGKTIDKDKKQHIGAVYKDLPRNCEIGNDVLAPVQKADYGDQWDNWGMNSFCMYVKLDDGASLAEFAAFANKVVCTDRPDDKYQFRKEVTALPLKDTHYVTDIRGLPGQPTNRSTETVLIIIAFAIVIIAAINFLNFSNALIPMRIKSINTRKILGATKGSLVLQIMAESLLISLISFAIAIGLIALLSLTSLSQISDAGLSLSGNLPVVGITLAAALIVGVLAGLLPALRMTSYSPAVVLKGNFGLSPKGQMMRNVLIGFQFFASTALITGAMFMQKQRDYMTRTADYGFQKDELIVCELPLEASLPKDLNVLVNDMKKLPFVKNAALSWSTLGESGNSQGWVLTTPEGETVNPRTLFSKANYLATMGIRIVEGRDFNETDTAAIIVNRLARDKFKDVVDVGRTLRFGWNEYTVVGICDDIMYSTVHTPKEPIMFVDMPYPMHRLNVRVAKGTNMFEAVDQIRRQLARYDTNFPFEVYFYDHIMDENYKKENRLSEQITAFSLLSVLISVVGVFGLVMFDSEYRRREIAVRKVFGASVGGIVRMFNLKYLKILVIAFVLSVPVAWYVISRWMENFAYRTDMSWWVFAISFIGLAAVTAATVTYQCWRAAKANPIESLKYE